MDALEAREAALRRMDEELETKRKEALQEADRALQVSGSRFEKAVKALESKREEAAEEVRRERKQSARSSSDLRKDEGQKSARSMASSARRRNNQDEDGNVPQEIGPDAVIRLQRAKLKALSENVEQLTAKNHALSSDNISLRKNAKESHEEVGRLRKRIQSLEGTKDKLKADNEKLTERLKVLEQQVTSQSRELKEQGRANRQVETEGNNKEIRLNRAYEEIERLKEKLEKAEMVQRNSTDLNADSQMKKMQAEIKKLEKQRSDLVAAFKKQLKLIDVLKRQKIHLEAAKMLSFTEEEFSRLIETNKH